jgi:hypothetical protein
MVDNNLPDNTSKLFDVGKSYPPLEEVERLAKYKRGKKIFDGKTYDVYNRYPYAALNKPSYDESHLYGVYNRAEKLFKNTPYQDQLRSLYVAINLVDILIVKPGDLMVGEPPTYDSTKPDDSYEQERLNSIIEENDLNTLIHEIVTGAGIRGDSFIKTYYSYRQDFSDVPAGVSLPTNIKPEPIVEAVNANYVFPELSRGSSKRFKAINIATLEWVEEGKFEVPYLDVERHVPGAIIYERFRLRTNGVDNRYGVPIELFVIDEQVSTGRNADVVSTGVAHPLVFHIPYKTTDDSWQGISAIEKIESVLAAINDRIAQIDFILWKHSDPSISGPALEGESVQFGGKYIEIGKEDPRPQYLVWDAQLESAFKELELLIGTVFQMSETPQFIFGTTLAGEGNAAGGTSHTTGDALKVRFFPLISKVKRIRMHVDKAVRYALWTAQLLENYANNEVDGYVPYEAQYPNINWRDGLPRDEKTLAEVAQIRTGGKPTQAVIDAIKELDEVGDVQAKAHLERIKEDETAMNDFAAPDLLQPPNNKPKVADNVGDQKV